jgi:RNA polymerase sigma-70 factor (ECF subfamily)
MASRSTDPATRASELLVAAQGGDEGAFASLIEPYRGELHAHCYRMLGSVYDAEDALQEAMIRAWRGLSRFEGRSALRSWLYTIATNTCLNQIARRSKRVLPRDFGPAVDGTVAPGTPVSETVWIEPYPDELLGIEDGYAAPEARYEQREAVELAFVAALQNLPANQRAVLILREVLGYSAKESADMLETSVASVNSALQRARASVEERVPEQSQQQTLRSLGDDRIRELVDRYVDAWERNDVDQFVELLTDDACFTMPPLATWYRGRAGISTWARNHPLGGEWRWRAVLTQANGQVALAFYSRLEDDGPYEPFALNLLTLQGEKVSQVDAFIVRSIESSDPEAYVRFPEQAQDPARLQGCFERFGLPAQLG